VFDLEMMNLLATTETDLFRGTGNSTKILWKVCISKTLELRKMTHIIFLKGGDWIVFVSNVMSVFAWNSSQNLSERVQLITKEGILNPTGGEYLTFDGNETLFYPVAGDRTERRVRNLQILQVFSSPTNECANNNVVMFRFTIYELNKHAALTGSRLKTLI
jgi:hypothetical protein